MTCVTSDDDDDDDDDDDYDDDDNDDDASTGQDGPSQGASAPAGGKAGQCKTSADCASRYRI